MEAFVQNQVLQTRTVSMDEVKANMGRWKEAFVKEYESLTSGPVTPISREEFESMKAQGIKMQVLPMKAVATEKPTKLKARVVVCGNYAEGALEGETAAGGACPMTIRAVVHAAAQNGWELGSLDVTGAFLQAPRRPSDVVSIVEPPHILRLMGITAPGERWKVSCALYGFIESPADWGRHRDTTLKALTWSHAGRVCRLRPTAERHLWEVLEDEVVKGVMVTYVDDFLTAAGDDLMKSLMAKLRETWTCSDPEYAVQGKTMRYCGYDLEKIQNGFALRQTNYVRDLLGRRKVTRTEIVPMMKVEEEEDEVNPPQEVPRAAQAITGELSWLAQRTRPDIGYAVSFMSRMIHRRPAFVLKVGDQVLAYLKGTESHGLVYQAGGDSGWLKIFADASFGPSHEGYKSVQGVVASHCGSLLQWESTKQPFVAQTTTG